MVESARPGRRPVVFGREVALGSLAAGNFPWQSSTTENLMPRYALPPGASWYPAYLPYPDPIPEVSSYPVPNATAVNWPQAQFAPRFLPAGSRSFQPFNSAQGVTTRVIAGSGNPFDTQTPAEENAYAGASADYGCGCGGGGGSYSGADGDDENWSPWAYLVLGAGIALVLKKAFDSAKSEPPYYND